MSQQTEIDRIVGDKEDIRQSIINKGVDVPVGTSLDLFASKIDQIASAGTFDPVAVYFNWLNSEHEPMNSTVYVQRYGSVSLPANFESNIYSGYGLPALNYATTSGIPSGVTLSSVPYDLYVTAEYAINSGSAYNYPKAWLQIDNSSGGASVYLEFTTQRPAERVTVNWGDGSSNETCPAGHTYSTVGTYTIYAYNNGVNELNIGGSFANPYIKKIYVTSQSNNISSNTFNDCTRLQSIITSDFSPSPVTYGGAINLRYCPHWVSWGKTRKWSWSIP
ncbi:hypothetical protein FACS189496_4330 [Bacilli bacterium]|nr:hypothetical protein FACS189496_4330 [Bacilli bacterium]